MESLYLLRLTINRFTPDLTFIPYHSLCDKALKSHLIQNCLLLLHCCFSIPHIPALSYSTFLQHPHLPSPNRLHLPIDLFFKGPSFFFFFFPPPPPPLPFSIHHSIPITYTHTHTHTFLFLFPFCFPLPSPPPHTHTHQLPIFTYPSPFPLPRV
ncbi:hypothetical protein, unlikely [Trypanosoma brucei gambiense DAL972]|uniref:Uncharacterized protein n=1 Tax=Trypanosoma brucei gambiense (strain MHOM/CI/86/DAL972) TaxID=679716 RepID=C9ZZE7_TRYB9|nr:hypothetical protein, unlikely [Trypanosoma brucei gambiense DAL972]CBH14796.1 hypothetical protein, unlikely [Trypanosoma brucei gambiense DAL972]|eukprot:XP_011777062.1 hypothetical protein, unlikely [Trypanosoma brucei gambiense DAL972]